MFERLAPEQHDTLEGVPEPSENPALYGHETARAMLASAYKAGKLPHALLFSGPQGIGKATLAFHLAYHLLKHGDSAQAPDMLAEPDVNSQLFRQMASGSHPSILHLTRPLNDKTKNFKTVLTVDEIRKVSRFLSMTSHDGSYRVVIVDPADDMNTNAANALLKNLEEPPSRTVFILIVHAPGSLLPTIRSRCQTVRLSALDQDGLIGALGAANHELPEGDGSAAELARLTEGSARKAILLTQYGGLEIANAIEQIVGVDALDIGAAYRVAEAVSGRDQAIQFQLFNEHSLALLSKAATTAAHEGNQQRAAALSEAWEATRAAINETETYNLDHKQHALETIYRLQKSMRM
ncbi:DNA polymerase III subunit delta' [Mesorhizobium sp. SB112]|uniref:DNA polymerase III subunit delta' n=1 Tax=Mesorhizobium sp. SB112 TaxID=3151853 RepID=UPI00326374D8